MTHLAYDTVKDRLARLISNSRFLRTLFYLLLDLMFLRSRYIRREIKRVFSNLKGNRKVLDAGCGFGQYERFLLNKFKNIEVTAIDIKEDYLEDCRYYFQKETPAKRVTFSNIDLYNIGYNCFFDFVLCVDVLEHIEGDLTVLKNFGSSLKKGGFFLMHSPSSCYSGKKGDDFHIDEHFRDGYTREEISHKLKEAGLIPLKIEYTYGWAGHLAWMIGVKAPMIMLSKSKVFGLLSMMIYMPLILPFFLLLNTIDYSFKVKKGRGIYALSRKE